MTHDDFDDLDRALAALPQEEPPAGLHARIMAATVYRPAPSVPPWEVWLMGTLIALAAWSLWAVVTAPSVGIRIADEIARLVTNAGLTSDYTLLWLAMGVSITWWVSLLSFPSSRRKRIEAQ
jgi:hypothetical protein